MNPILEMMSGFQRLSKLYEKNFSGTRKTYGVTQLEIDILAFLRNNPQLDTASDIIRYRLLPKANVSIAVELLIQKGMLKRTVDVKDRRRVHLSLLPESEELLETILERQSVFWDTIFDGIPKEEREHFMKLSHWVAANVEKGLERDEKHGTEK